MPDSHQDNSPTIPGSELRAVVRATIPPRQTASDSMIGPVPLVPPAPMTVPVLPKVDSPAVAPVVPTPPKSEKLPSGGYSSLSSGLRSGPHTVVMSGLSQIGRAADASSPGVAQSREQAAPQIPLGIDLNFEQQQRSLVDFLRPYNDFDWTEGMREGRRYRPQNREFEYPDAIVAYGAFRHLKPRRIMIIESAYFAALALDARERHPELKHDVTFVTSRLDRLEPVTKPEDQLTIIANSLSRVPMSSFDRLKSGDILSVQTTHTIAHSGDVCRLFFDLLPRLAPGVFVHLEGAFYPFEYPADWTPRGGKSPNQAYLLRAFLQFNRGFEVILFNDFAQQAFGNVWRARAPLWLWGRANTLWLRRVES